jgi:MazG family protein
MKQPDADTKLSELTAIITRLRQPDGCPWDRKQTVSSFRPYLVEELHELIEALDLDDRQLIKEELGDLLFQVLFLSNLYEEQGDFTLSEVFAGINAKMVRRHPHVFGDIQIDSEKELRRNWNLVKTKENAAKGKTERSIFAFPRSLPALNRAQRVSDRAVSSGFEWPDLTAVFAKLEEELAELKEATEKGNRPEIEEEIGDLLFTMVNVARKSGFDAETSLQKATDKFIQRFTKMSTLAATDGTAIENLDIAAMQKYWQLVKQDE